MTVKFFKNGEVGFKEIAIISFSLIASALFLWIIITIFNVARQK